MRYSVVVISGLLGSGTSEVSRAVAEQLKWQRYSSADVLREQLLQKYPDVEVSFSSYWAGLSDEEKKMEQEKKDALRKGNIVMDVEYCKDLIEEPGVLSVFLDATNSVRAKNLYGNFSQQSLHALYVEERNQRVEGQRLFEYDPRTLSYDLTFNSGHMELSVIVSAIIGAIRDGIEEANGRDLSSFPIIPDAFKEM